MGHTAHSSQEMAREKGKSWGAVDEIVMQLENAFVGESFCGAMRPS